MNREIKFRLWDIDKKSMLNPALQLKSDSIIQRVNLETRTSEKVIWLQFTGLKDKNGVDIYEGDILQEDNGSASFVIWFRTGYALQSPGSEAIDIEYSSYYYKVRIIGNIHENPELLK